MTQAQRLPLLSEPERTPTPRYPELDIRRVLLVYPFAVAGSFDLETVQTGGAYLEAPIGLGYVQSYLKKVYPDIECRLYDANAEAIKEILRTDVVDMERLWGMLREEISAFKPDIVGISSLFVNIAATTHRIAAEVKSLNPRTVTVMGGHYPSSTPKQTLTDESVDFVVMSEGEKTFSELVSALRGGFEPKEVVNGVSYQESTLEHLTHAAEKEESSQPIPITRGEVIRVNKGALPSSLEEFPWPDRSTFDMDLYATYTRHWAFRAMDPTGARIATMTASRGCPFKCTFCQSKEFWGKEIRYRDPKDVVNEMRHLRDEHGINTFVFNDDNIMFRRTSLLELCGEMKRQNLKINWMSGGGIQVSTMKPDVIQAVVETGLRLFNLAIETGNPNTLRRIQKPLTRGVAEEVITNIRKYDDVWISSNFITGFYFETLEDIQDTVNYAGRLDLDWRSIYAFTPLPETPDFDACVERGYIKPWEGWQGKVQDDFISLSTDSFTAEQVRVMNYNAGLKHNYVNNRNLKANPSQALREFSFVLENIPDHALGFYTSGQALRSLGRLEEALVSMKRAQKLVKASEAEEGHLALRSHCLYKGSGVSDEEGRWCDYFREFGIDIDREVEDVGRALAQSR